MQTFSFNDLPDVVKDKWLHALSDVVNSKEFIGGIYVKRFEESFAKYLDAGYVVGVGNGYDALFIALKAIGIGPGHLVAVPNHTFIATWLAVSATGAHPVGIDTDSSGLINLERLFDSRERFSAVIPVHMHGNPVDMKSLIEWAAPRKVKVIEDCAQAHGASVHNRKVGTWGDIAAYSFYPTKNLGALGDAGAIVTNDFELSQRARSLANYGRKSSTSFEVTGQGYNSRLDPMQASVLSVNLTYLDEWNDKRKYWASQYFSLFSELGYQTIQYTVDSVFHHLVCLSNNRELTQSLLQSHGIQLTSHYTKSAQEMFYHLMNMESKIEFGNAEKLNSKTISLPLTPWMNANSFDIVSDTMRRKEIQGSILN